MSGKKGAGASRDAVDFFRAHDLGFRTRRLRFLARELDAVEAKRDERDPACGAMREAIFTALGLYLEREGDSWHADLDVAEDAGMGAWLDRSEEHTSELQSLMRISYAVFCLEKKKKINDK